MTYENGPLLILSMPRGVADLKKLSAAGWSRRSASPLGLSHEAFFKAHGVRSARAVAAELTAALGLEETKLVESYRPISQHKRTPFVAVLAPFDPRDAVFKMLRALEVQIGFVRLVKGLLNAPREEIEERLKATYISAPDYCEIEGRTDGRWAERMEWGARIREWAREHRDAFMDRIEAQERRAERLAAEAARPPVSSTAPAPSPAPAPATTLPAPRPKSGWDNGPPR